MKLEEMKYFVEIVKARSINQASKNLFVAQPALSRMLTALEKELGFPLLERSKHGITPTKAGLAVYADCVKILQLYNDSKHRWQDIAYETADTHTTVRIVALPMICNSTMNQVFCEVAQKYPRIQLKLSEAQLLDIPNKLLLQSHTLAISHYSAKTKEDTYSFAKKHRLQVIPLFDDEYKFYASCKSPLVGKKLTDADLKECTLASYSNIEATKAVFQDTAFHSKFKKVFYLSSKEAMMDMVVANHAISSFAEIMAQDIIAPKRSHIEPLCIESIYQPITYFVYLSSVASLEEEIVANIILRWYQKLAQSK